MIDEKTKNREYPLPHPRNLMEEDVPRIRQAWILADKDIHRIKMNLFLEEPNGDNATGIWWPN